MTDIKYQLQRQKYLDDLKGKLPELPDYESIIKQDAIISEEKHRYVPLSVDQSRLEEAQRQRVEYEWFKWKEFIFPAAITKFEIESDAKVATYEYAMRDGAEHERVSSYKVIRLSGIFLVQSLDVNETAFDIIQRLRETDDNRPGIFSHKEFGEFLCILKSLKITQAAEQEQRFQSVVFSTYAFDMEFWEHTPSNSPKLKDLTSTIFPAPQTKPPGNSYLSSTVFTELDYKNYQALFYAIRAGKIEPSAKDSKWTALYVGGKPTQIQKDAYEAWVLYNKVLAGTVKPSSKEPSWTAYYVNGQPTEIQKFVYTVWNGDSQNGLIYSKGEKWYVVKTGDDPVKIAKKFGTDLATLWQTNRGIKVRNTPHDLAPPVIGGVETSSSAGSSDVLSTAAQTGLAFKNWTDYSKSIGNGNVVQLVPYYKGTHTPHHGADILGATGAKIYAFAGGTCVRADYRVNGFGLQVYIRSSDGYTQIYGHLSQIIPMEDGSSSHNSALLGQKVQPGQIIGLMGCSGRCIPRAGGAKQSGDNTYEQRKAGVATHLHFEVRDKNNIWVNPVDYVNKNAGLNVGTSKIATTQTPAADVEESSNTIETITLGTGTDGYYWNTVMFLWPGDRIKIP